MRQLQHPHITHWTIVNTASTEMAGSIKIQNSALHAQWQPRSNTLGSYPRGV